MKIFLFPILLPFLGLIVAFGQDIQPSLATESTCQGKIDELEFPLGLKNGMTPSQAAVVLGRDVRVRYIKSKILATALFKSGATKQIERVTRDSIGESEFVYYPRSDTNIGSLNLRFWQDHLYSLALIYDLRDFNWFEGKSDSVVVSETLHFPVKAWVGKRLTCLGFYIDADRRADDVVIEITNSEIKNQVRAKAEQNISEDEKKLPLQPDFKTPPEGPPVLKRRKPA